MGGDPTAIAMLHQYYTGSLQQTNADDVIL